VTPDTRLLGEVVRFVGGGTPDRSNPDYWDGSVPWATVKDFNTGAELHSPAESITQLGLQNSASNLVDVGTVVIPTRMALGKAAITLAPTAINQDLKAVIPTTEELDTRYLLRYFLANSQKIEAMGKGATVKGVTLDQLRSLQIPCPPLPEQRRIAAILDKADALRAKRREAIAKLDQLLQSVFLEMFGDPVTNPRGLKKIALGALCEIGSGSTPSREVTANFEGDVPWIKSTEVDWGVIESTSESLSESGVRSARLKTFPRNTVVVALYGQGVTRGKCAITAIPATMNQACAGIRPSEHLDHIYLFQCLKLSYEHLRSQARGGNQENLNVGLLSGYEVPVPPRSAQSKFANFFVRTSDVFEGQTQALAACDALSRSLQVRFFDSH